MAAKAFTPNTDQAVALGSTAKRLLIRAKAGAARPRCSSRTPCVSLTSACCMSPLARPTRRTQLLASLPTSPPGPVMGLLGKLVASSRRLASRMISIRPNWPSSTRSPWPLLATCTSLCTTSWSRQIGRSWLRTCLQRSLAMTVRRLRNGRSMFGRICSACVSGLVGAAKAKPSEQSFWNPPPAYAARRLPETVELG